MVLVIALALLSSTSVSAIVNGTVEVTTKEGGWNNRDNIAITFGSFMSSVGFLR